MTWGDQAYGTAQAKGDTDAMIKWAMLRAAKRLEIVASDYDLDDFLDSVRMDDLNEALTEHDEDPTKSDSTPT
jgi:hypothetical protein